MHNTPEFNAIGGMTICLSALNSFFQILNPLLTGVFYIASILWLIVQIYHKIKKAK
jgi:hypothetical protein